MKKRHRHSTGTGTVQAQVCTGRHRSGGPGTNVQYGGGRGRYRYVPIAGRSELDELSTRGREGRARERLAVEAGCPYVITLGEGVKVDERERERGEKRV